MFLENPEEKKKKSLLFFLFHSEGLDNHDIIIMLLIAHNSLASNLAMV